MRQHTSSSAAEPAIADILHQVDAGADPRQAVAAVQKRIDTLLARGLEIPANLRALKRSLELACVAESQGR